MAREEMSKLERDVRARVVDALQKRVAPRFQSPKVRGWQSAAAREIGCHAATINRILADGSTVVPDLLFVEKLAAYLGDPPDEFLSSAEDPTPRLRQLPGFKAALKSAQQLAEAQRRSVSTGAWERAADFRAPGLSSVTPDLLLALVSAYSRDTD